MSLHRACPDLKRDQMSSEIQVNDEKRDIVQNLGVNLTSEQRWAKGMRTAENRGGEDLDGESRERRTLTCQ